MCSPKYTRSSIDFASFANRSPCLNCNVYSITCYDRIDKCVQQVYDFDCVDELSVALSYGYDFTKLEEMERHTCVPQNVHEVALTLQALQTIPHVAITGLETNKVLKVNGHRLKLFYESWTSNFTASIKNEHAMPPVEPMTENTSVYWEATQHTKKSDLPSFSLILYFSHFISFFSFSYIPFLLFSTLRTMFCFKCGGIGKMLVFLFWFSLFFRKKKKEKKEKIYDWSFWTLIGLWEYEYYVWELSEIDEYINWMNECACKF